MNERFDFDALAREVASGFSRREALRRLGLGLAAGLLAELTGWLPAWPTARAQAATVAPSVSLCFPEIVTKGSLTSWLTVSSTLELAARQLQPSGCTGCTAEACCNGVCVGLQSDPKNCGACGRTCGLGQSCENGICLCISDAACVFPGPNGRSLQLTCCHGNCTDFQTDPSNCGSCGHVCAAGLTCSKGVCGQLTSCPRPGQYPCGLVCCESTQACCPGSANGPCCNPGLICCGTVCADLTSDAKNCGTCEHVCPSGICCQGTCCPGGQSCSNGLCCPLGLTGCGSVIGCANLAGDVNNCGTCGHRCPAGESCVNGHCTCGNLGTDCPSGQSCSNGICCPPGLTGSNGICCPPGLTNCNGTCVNLQTDVNNCKFCGVVCPNFDASTQPVCSGGACSVVCAPGYTLCLSGIGPFSHACVDLQTDGGHCGSCDNNCTFPDLTCCGGTCTDLALDSHNCGDCGHVCGSTLGVRHPCVAGNCVGG